MTRKELIYEILKLAVKLEKAKGFDIVLVIDEMVKVVEKYDHELLSKKSD